jgi:hypothetical protein
MQTTKILVAALGLAATVALAQPPPGGFGGPPGADIERLTVLLDLDPYQKQEVERVMKEQRAAFRAEREATDERPSFEEMQARREQVLQATIAKLQGVLTEQQITKLKLLMEPPAGGLGRRRGAAPDAE